MPDIDPALEPILELPLGATAGLSRSVTRQQTLLGKLAVAPEHFTRDRFETASKQQSG